MRRALSRPLAALALILALASVARAQPATAVPVANGAAGEPDAPDRPWASGVSADLQKQALILFEDGNRLFETSEYAGALAKYREAIKAWDHPAIRYNAAVSLINLDQPLAANENLELALRYGDGPFSAETYQQALTYRKLLRGQLAQLKVACAEAGAEVTLDGASLFVAPGEAARWLMPGAHQIVARKAGFLTETRSLSLLPGKPSVETLALQRIESPPTKTVRRWPTWRPWAVIGGGALVGLAGAAVLLDARRNFDAYDQGVRTACPAPTGCPSGEVPASALDARARGDTENVIAVSLFAIGGAAVASGVVLLIANQPRTVPADDRSPVSVTPLIGRSAIGLSLAFER